MPPSKYDSLDPRTGLEQALADDLRAALGVRGCTVIHHGNSSSPAPGGKPDIEVRDPVNRRLILVEVTRRKGSAADGEFIPVTAHLEAAIAAGGFDDYCCFFVSPATSARMSMNIRDLFNRSRTRDGKAGRVVAVDFLTLEILLRKMAETDPAMFPSSRLGTFFSEWDKATDDIRTRLLVAQIVLREDPDLAHALTEEMQKRDAEQERQLKKQISNLENKLREFGITGSAANITLIQLTFMRLYEERKQRLGGHESRFTQDGFKAWVENLPLQVRNTSPNRFVNILLREIAEDEELKAAGLLAGNLHPSVTDDFVTQKILEVFDQYEFYGSAVDVLGVVFETLARRGEKDTRIGQFFTAQEVVNFCIEISRLHHTDLVLDPAVGTARFLIAAMKRMLEKASSSKKDSAAESAIRSKLLLGVDIDEWVATIAKMNMYIHGDGKTNIAEANGLILGDRPIFHGHPEGINGQIDIVLTNPPLGNTNYMVALHKWVERAGCTPSEDEKTAFLEGLGTVPMSAAANPAVAKAVGLAKNIEQLNGEIESLLSQPRDARGEKSVLKAKEKRARLTEQLARLNAAVPANGPGRRPGGELRKGSALFLGAIANYLKPVRDQREPIEWQGGKALVVVDEAILNSADYADVREFITKRYFLKAVFSLGRSAFQYLAHTDAKTSILYLIRKPNDNLKQREPVFFGHSERVGYGATGKWVGNDLPVALEAFRKFEEVVRQSYRNSAFDSTGCAASLNAATGSYGESWHHRPLGSDGDRLSYFFTRYLLLAESLRNAGGKTCVLGDVLVPKTLHHPEASPTGEYEFAVAERIGTISFKGVQDVKYKSTDLWIVEQDDIIISGIDLIHGAVGVARDDVVGKVMSKEMFAYRVRPGVKVLPDYAALLLRTPQVRDMIFGLVGGTSNRTRITDAAEILQIPIPAPPSLAEQEKAARLGREAADLRRTSARRLDEATSLVAGRWPSPGGE